MNNADSIKYDDVCNNFSSHDSDFLFGFNDSKFSDRVLIVEILADDESHRSQALRSEETAFMEILKYMYSGTLTSRTTPALLDVLKLADKFQVVSCMRLCTSLLIKLPMSTKSALFYLDLTSILPMTDGVQLLADAAKQFLTTRYKDVDDVRVRDKIMQMPLAGIEAILSSDDLRVSSEDELFDFALEWAKTHYPNVEDQRKILSTNLGHYIRFPYMSPQKLREVLSCNVLDNDFANKALTDALYFKIVTPHHHRTKSAIEYSNSTPFVRRDYKRVPVKVLEFEFPSQELLVYFDLTFDECANLKPSSQALFSETISFDGQPTYYLDAECLKDERNCLHFSVGLGLARDNVGHVLDYEFAAREKYTEEFVLKSSGSLHFTAEESLELYSAPWVCFMAGQSLDSIDGIMYLEVKLIIKQ